MMNTEKHAADILLDNGVAWRLPSPWLLRLFGKRTIQISIKAIRLGTLLELSSVYSSMGITEESLTKDPHTLIQSNLKLVCRIAAICILNSKPRIRLFSGVLTKFLVSRLTANMLLEVMLFVATYSGVTSFISTIRLIGEMKVTSPKNLGPENQGSQQL